MVGRVLGWSVGRSWVVSVDGGGRARSDQVFLFPARGFRNSLTQRSRVLFWHLFEFTSEEVCPYAPYL